MKADSSMGPLLNVAMVLNTKWCRINIRTRKVRGVCSAFYLVPPGAIPYTLGPLLSMCQTAHSLTNTYPLASAWWLAAALVACCGSNYD